MLLNRLSSIHKPPRFVLLLLATLAFLIVASPVLAAEPASPRLQSSGEASAAGTANTSPALSGTLAQNGPEATCPAGGQCFADVPSGNPFYESINRIFMQDLVAGYACGGPNEPCDPQNRPYYRPGAGVTRQQMAKFIDNARRLPEIFMDVPSGPAPIRSRNDTGAAISAYSTSGQALTAQSSTAAAIYAQSGNTSVIYGFSTGGANGIGVSGQGATGVQGSGDVGVKGIGSPGVFGQSTSGRGVSGTSETSHGVQGASDTGSGVLGVSDESYGVQGLGSTGVYGEGSFGTRGTGSVVGVQGNSTTGIGVHGAGQEFGVTGFTSEGTGVKGTSTSSSGNDAGVWGLHDDGIGVLGESVGGFGVTGISDYIGVTGRGTALAGFFNGDVEITGSCTGCLGTSRIDHPLDPANKYLNQSAVESQEMKTVYDGNVTTDAQGNATVTLPSYAETINHDFRYQLTVIGDFAQAIVSREIEGNTFAIKTDKPNIKVSWLVIGLRHDAYAEQNRTPAEQDKPANERGLYMHPELYGQPESVKLDKGPHIER